MRAEPTRGSARSRRAARRTRTRRRAARPLVPRGRTVRQVIGVSVDDLPGSRFSPEDGRHPQRVGRGGSPPIAAVVCSKATRYARSPLAPAATTSIAKDEQSENCVATQSNAASTPASRWSSSPRRTPLRAPSSTTGLCAAPHPRCAGQYRPLSGAAAPTPGTPPSRSRRTSRVGNRTLVHRIGSRHPTAGDRPPPKQQRRLLRAAERCRPLSATFVTGSDLLPRQRSHVFRGGSIARPRSGWLRVQVEYRQTTGANRMIQPSLRLRSPSHLDGCSVELPSESVRTKPNEPVSAAATLRRPFLCPSRGPQDHDQL